MTDEEIEKLIEERDFYKGIVEQSNVMLYISEIVDDKYLKVIWANEYYAANLGVSIEDRNKDLKKHYSDRYHAKDGPTAAKVIEEMRKTRKSFSGIYQFYLENRNKTNWVYSNITPYKYDEQGKLTQVLLGTVFLTDKSINPERLADLQKEVALLKYNLLLSKLSKAEKSILEHLANGKSEKEIADIQCRSIHTIKTHLKNIRKKLGFTKNTELVKFAIETGIA